MVTVNNNKLRVVVVAWLWCSVVALQSMASKTQDENASTLGYEKVRFKVTTATTAYDYTKFIKDVRNRVLRDGVLNNEIPVLRDRSTTPVSDPQRFILVELSNESEDTITLAIDVTDLYVIGYEAAGRSFFFRDAPQNSGQYLFTDTQQHTLASGGSYGDLARLAGGVNRDRIELGREEFIVAVSNLHYGTSLGRAFIVIIQMISEAARFYPIQMRVQHHFDSGESFLPGTYMVALENSWGSHCTQVQQSTEGVFERPVRVHTAPGDSFAVYNNVRQVIVNLALMYFVCRRRLSSILEYPMLIRPVVGKADLISDDMCTASEPTVLISDDMCTASEPTVLIINDMCKESEPTVLIIGRDGLCVDVRDGKYNDGNLVLLWPCHGSINQLWKIARDGTLRSNDKCLTTYGYSPGDYVMIYDCDKVVVAAKKWEIWGNGTIINPESGLVLNAASGSQGTTLTVATNTYASKQSWLPTRDKNPLVVSIIGFRYLCMQANGAAMWLETCASGKAEQKWALYPDGTIRPTQRLDQCLKCDSDSSSTVITIGSCSSGFSGQRWVFTNEGTILNLYNGLVMDVKASNPSLQQIIIYPYTGKPNQLWVQQP